MRASDAPQATGIEVVATQPTKADRATLAMFESTERKTLPELPSWSRLWASHDENLALIHLNYHVMPGEVAGD